MNTRGVEASRSAMSGKLWIRYGFNMRYVLEEKLIHMPREVRGVFADGARLRFWVELAVFGWCAD
jgi:hypothetical protein